MQRGPAREIVLLNAGAAIYVSGIAGSIRYGVTCRKSIDSGKSRKIRNVEAILMDILDKFIECAKKCTDGYYDINDANY